MIQEILTHIIVFLAVAYTVYSAVKQFLPSVKKQDAHYCAGCSGCDLKAMKGNKRLKPGIISHKR